MPSMFSLLPVFYFYFYWASLAFDSFIVRHKKWIVMASCNLSSSNSSSRFATSLAATSDWLLIGFYIALRNFHKYKSLLYWRSKVLICELACKQFYYIFAILLKAFCTRYCSPLCFRGNCYLFIKDFASTIYDWKWELQEYWSLSYFKFKQS